MSEQYLLINDIMENHSARMQNLRKYYPFFCLAETTFTQYKEGKYAELDMGYITMASLRFFINENQFNEREITFERYEAFLRELLARDFLLQEEDGEEHELVGYIFDKLKNDGKPFEFSFFDPEEKKRKSTRVKLIDSRVEHGEIFYYITSEAIEFYLDTKEMKDESNISVQQLLLEKMIRAKNFKGGIDVVRRINGEVSKLVLRKEEVIKELGYDVFTGAKACDEYMETVAKWFEEEQKLFRKNKELVEQAIRKADMEPATAETGIRSEGSVRSMEEIHQLDTELKKTIHKHSQLIQETIELQKIADKMIGQAKLRKLRPVFDFEETKKRLIKEDTPDKLGMVLLPFFGLHLQKSFSMTAIDRLLAERGDSAEAKEQVDKTSLQEDYVYEDELEDERIAHNFGIIFLELLWQLKKKGHIDLFELYAILEIKLGTELFRNGDFYSFLVHISQKKEYSMKEVLRKQETFFEQMVIGSFGVEEQDEYENMELVLTHKEEQELEIAPGFVVTNIVFETATYRAGMR